MHRSRSETLVRHVAWVLVAGLIIAAAPALRPAAAISEGYGTLHVCKNVQWGVWPQDETVSFELCIIGPLDGDTGPGQPQCVTFGPGGGSHHFEGLIPGEYQVYETDPGPQWIATHWEEVCPPKPNPPTPQAEQPGPSMNVQVWSDETTCATIRNTFTNACVAEDPPLITCPADLDLPAGGTFDLTALAPATAVDDCGFPVETFAEITSDVAGECPVARIVTVSWSATDSEGRTNTCQQTVRISDADSDGDGTVDCLEDDGGSNDSGPDDGDDEGDEDDEDDNGESEGDNDSDDNGNGDEGDDPGSDDGGDDGSDDSGDDGSDDSGDNIGDNSGDDGNDDGDDDGSADGDDSEQETPPLEEVIETTTFWSLPCCGGAGAAPLGLTALGLAAFMTSAGRRRFR